MEYSINNTSQTDASLKLLVNNHFVLWTVIYSIFSAEFFHAEFQNKFSFFKKKINLFVIPSVHLMSWYYILTIVAYL